LPQPVALFELDAEVLQALPGKRIAAPSRFPPVVRDLSVLVDGGVPVQAMLDAMRSEGPAIATELRVFDLYQGPSLPAGKKSLAFRVVMQHTERTLTDAEADAASEALRNLLARRFGASLRI
jgi:phenylalanyl-tRNA synthetase beta chain